MAFAAPRKLGDGPYSALKAGVSSLSEQTLALPLGQTSSLAIGYTVTTAQGSMQSVNTAFSSELTKKKKGR